MHDIRAIRDNPDAFDHDLKRRGLEPLSAELIALDEARKAAVSAAQANQERRNALAKEIGGAKKAKDEARAAALMAEVAALKEAGPGLETAQAEAGKALDARLAAIPNRPKADVPEGADEHGNVLYRSHASTRERLGEGKEHFEIGEALGLMDFETAAKLSGSRFVVLKGQLARLERALGQFMLDLHTQEHGYTEVAPPIMVRDEAMFGTAQLPKFEDDQFAVLDGEALRGASASEQPRRWLVPTAEVPLTNLVRESILREENCRSASPRSPPVSGPRPGRRGGIRAGCCASTSSTRSSWSRSPRRGLGRRARADAHQRRGRAQEARPAVPGDDPVHRRHGLRQPEDLRHRGLGAGPEDLPGNLSCSVCGDFQARRMQARYRGKDGKPAFVHTLNGSGVAVGRALIAVLENYQNPDGSVTIPSVLAPYMGGLNRIEGPR